METTSLISVLQDFQLRKLGLSLTLLLTIAKKLHLINMDELSYKNASRDVIHISFLNLLKVLLIAVFILLKISSETILFRI